MSDPDINYQLEADDDKRHASKYDDPEWIAEKMFGEIPNDDPIIFLQNSDEEPF
jgi:hypothetical protein